MTKYEIEYSQEVITQLRQAPGNYRQRFRRIIEALADDPRPESANELRNRLNRYRIRIDNWRLVYEVEDDILIVLILRIGKKSGPEFYDDLPE